jgi:hypothetical protein
MTNDTKDAVPPDDIEDALPGPRTDEPGLHTPVTTGTIAAVLQGDDGELTPINVRLDWTSRTPRKVILAGQYTWSPTVVEWPFDRELLISGGGCGDLRVRHRSTDALVVLDSPNGYAELAHPPPPGHPVMKNKHGGVPRGAESTGANQSD